MTETRFLQIGKRAWNVANIRDVNLDYDDFSVSAGVMFHLDNGEAVVLKSAEAGAFRYWWREKANVYTALA